MLVNPSWPSSLPSSRSAFRRIEAIVHNSSRIESGLTPYSCLFLLTTCQRSGPPQLTFNPYVVFWGVICCGFGVEDGTMDGMGVITKELAKYSSVFSCDSL